MDEGLGFVHLSIRGRGFGFVGGGIDGDIGVFGVVRVVAGVGGGGGVGG